MSTPKLRLVKPDQRPVASRKAMACRLGFHKYGPTRYREVWDRKYGHINVYERKCARCEHVDVDAGL
jgi:hypothetical protein